MRMGAAYPFPIIGLTGNAGSGKTTVARYLAEQYGFQWTRFAGPLKSMLRALGLSERQVDGDLKEVPCDLLCGKTPRWAMQSLGTEWGRNCIDSEFLVNAWRARLERDANVVVDDTRFPNEVAVIKNLGGIVVKIERPGQAIIATSQHVSENEELAHDLVITNDGDLNHLFSRVDHRLIRAPSFQCRTCRDLDEAA
jgi:hypothetical protein